MISKQVRETGPDRAEVSDKLFNNADRFRQGYFTVCFGGFVLSNNGFDFVLSGNDSANDSVTECKILEKLRNKTSIVKGYWYTRSRLSRGYGGRKDQVI
jgi:hypothetical protein